MFNKFKEKYRSEGCNEGYERGKKTGFEDGYNKALVFATEYYEGAKQDEYIKREADKVKSQQQTNIETIIGLDEFMTWIKYVYEICDSDFFRSYVFEKSTIQQIEDILTYLDFLSLSIEIQQMYPETVNYIPELIMAIHDVKENKLMLEEAEKIIRK